MNSNNKLSFLIFFIFILYVFNAFTNSYIVSRENYQIRLIKGAGDCDKSGYGFYKKILHKFKNIDQNISVKNFNNFPSPGGYFYEYTKKKTTKYLILIGAEQNELNKYLQDNFSSIYNEKNCYFLSK